MPSRRRLLLGAAIAAPVAALLARPAEQGGPHPAYFERLGRALREAGIAQARMVVDLPRLRANLAAIGRHTARTGMPLRAVLKSLPSLPLMDELARAWNSPRVMAFNAAQLQQLLAARPAAQALLGKPLPVAAAAQVLDALPPELGRGIEWLVDTPERLAQYRQLAEHRGQPLRINFEIDVGLHRGGFEDVDALGRALASLRGGQPLQWRGFMGYDAHVAALPDLPGMRATAWDESQRRWRAAWAAAEAALGPQQREALTLNTAGSPTFRLHDGKGLANEVSVGSAVLLPLDFEKPLLADLQPAAFIATPVDRKSVV